MEAGQAINPRIRVGDWVKVILDLMTVEVGADAIATRLGLPQSTVERWREAALQGMSRALDTASGKSAREIALERRLRKLQREFADLAVRHALVQRALDERLQRLHAAR